MKTAVLSTASSGRWLGPGCPPWCRIAELHSVEGWTAGRARGLHPEEAIGPSGPLEGDFKLRQSAPPPPSGWLPPDWPQDWKRVGQEAGPPGGGPQDGKRGRAPTSALEALCNSFRVFCCIYSHTVPRM